MQGTRHGHGDAALAGEHFRNLGPAADERDEVARAEPLLIHTELDGLDGTGIAERIAPGLIQRNEVNEHVELFTLRAADGGIHEGINARKRGLVVRFGADGGDVGHGYTSSASMRSYSA